MPQALLSAAGLATFIMCLPLSLLAQDRAASLSGVLQDANGEPIGGYWNDISEYAASVTLEAAEGGFRQMTHPDQQGRFHFSGLPAGTYTVSTRSRYFDSLKIEQTLLAGEETSWPPVRLVQAGSGCGFSQKIDPASTRFLAAGSAFGALAANIHDGQKPSANVRVTLACWLGRQ
jgi:Carboxypeptidase regulatory-like domain